MPEMKDFVDRFAFDCAKELERIDACMTHLLKTPSMWSEFMAEPNGVFAKLGVTPATAPEVHDRVNRMFYATLTNKELIKLVAEIYEDFKDTVGNAEHHHEGLKKGVVQNLIKHDISGINHFLSKPDKAIQAYKLALYDLNEKGIFTRRYTQEELDNFSEAKVRAMQNRLPIAEQPQLEQWDRNYGVGTGYGFGEITLVATAQALVAVEVGVVATFGAAIAMGVAGNVGVSGATALSLEQHHTNALLEGDRESVYAAHIMSRLYAFFSDLMMHAHHFES